MAKVEALSNIRFHSSQENLCLPNGKCSDCGNWCIYINFKNVGAYYEK